MATELKIPAVGESITEVQIGEWLKSEGDEIKPDEPLAVIDSEKTTFELPAPEGGRLAKILHQAGDTVKIGEAIAEIESGGKKAEPKAAGPKAKAQAPVEEKPAEKPKPKAEPAMEKRTEVEPPPPRPEPPESHKAEPTREEPKPIIKESREVKPVAATPTDGEEEVVPMTMLRRTVARRLVEAQQTMAMLTTFNEVDMSEALGSNHRLTPDGRATLRIDAPLRPR